MSRKSVRERISQLEEARTGQPETLETTNSPDSARSAADQDLARAPFLRISDIIALRSADIQTFEQLEDNLLEVPEPVWPRVLDLVRSRVVEVSASELADRADEVARAGTNGDTDRCLALTKAGDRCKNTARSGSKYCSSHKGYQPSEEELEARREGLLPSA